MQYVLAEVNRGAPIGPYLYSFIGKSDFPLPSSEEYPDMATGSDLYNIDNQTVFMYDREDDAWISQTGGVTA